MDIEMVTFYSVDRNGKHSNLGRHDVCDRAALTRFIENSVETATELKVVDDGEFTILHVVDRTLVFPVPAGAVVNNKWDSQKKIFAEIPMPVALNKRMVH